MRIVPPKVTSPSRLKLVQVIGSFRIIEGSQLSEPHCCVLIDVVRNRYLCKRRVEMLRSSCTTGRAPHSIRWPYLQSEAFAFIHDRLHIDGKI